MDKNDYLLLSVFKTVDISLLASEYYYLVTV